MTQHTLKDRLCRRPNNAALLAITNLAANTLGRWVDQNAAHWLNHIMLAVNFIVLATTVVREARRSTGDPGVIRTGGDQTGLGEKERLVDAGKE
ncbi:hypothetical protein ANOM_004701 [Aspergillus nomiae NRRL 13137]|uniref:Uncharacterized protein n=1 Tax=Aspergillus nomiae NRRL (strain ATCC 15546 / NRRL 13137 / CBS 260.88 / M93) TaxID=1509407 RepID=A0A0L1J4I0_ASPN3|nr:uncharacterized protein ANOM_004701 [Aspergillus nomiae NRRL 13137]KNG86333.1 hypothetical protein ANOM_004701 [Aspergillus nomiae NRRL 13137]